jgi:hypothetical protein
MFEHCVHLRPRSRVLLPLLLIVATDKEDDRYLLSRHRLVVNATNALRCRDRQDRTHEKDDDTILPIAVQVRQRSGSVTAAGKARSAARVADKLPEPSNCSAGRQFVSSVWFGAFSE